MNLTLNASPLSARRIIVWLCAGFMAVLLAACGSDGDDNVAPAASVPTITTQPASTSVTAPATATFTVVATGSDPLTYQWRKSGTAIEGATTASYTTPATSDADTGALYIVVVSNAAGSVTSAAATLTVGTAVIAPTVVTQPTPQTVTAPATATFTASFQGTEPLTYQWTRNNIAIDGATAATYTTPATSVEVDNGSVYAVTATNTGGTAKTEAAALTVNAAPTPATITAQPAAQSVAAGLNATFTVTASGDAPLAYQWFRNGAAIGGAIAASYTTVATAASDSGALFKVTVSNSLSSVTSAEVALTVTTTAQQPTAVAITTQPADVHLNLGAAASFSVAATGTAPITYQWFRNGAAIAGANSSTYTTPAAVQADSGALFTVVVSNAAGPVTSLTALLTVTTTGNPPSTNGTYARCLAFQVPLGSVLEVTSQSSLKTVEDYSAYRALGSAVFNGIHTSAYETTTSTVGSTTTTVITDYLDLEVSTGAATQYGEVVAQTGPNTFTIVFEPATVLPALVLNEPATVTQNGTGTLQQTVNGVPQPVTTQPVGGSYSVTFLGIESISVPAGTFDACKIMTTYSPTMTETSWLLVDRGVTIKSITAIGATIDSVVADSVFLDGRRLP